MVIGSFQTCTLVFNPRHNAVDMSDPSVSSLTQKKNDVFNVRWSLWTRVSVIRVFVQTEWFQVLG